MTLDPSVDPTTIGTCILSIQHRHGTEISIHRNGAEALSVVDEWVDLNWPDAGLTDLDADEPTRRAAYFESVMETEDYDIIPTPLPACCPECGAAVTADTMHEQGCAWFGKNGGPTAPASVPWDRIEDDGSILARSLDVDGYRMHFTAYHVAMDDEGIQRSPDKYRDRDLATLWRIHGMQQPPQTLTIDGRPYLVFAFPAG